MQDDIKTYTGIDSILTEAVRFMAELSPAVAGRFERDYKDFVTDAFLKDNERSDLIDFSSRLTVDENTLRTIVREYVTGKNNPEMRTAKLIFAIARANNTAENPLLRQNPDAAYYIWEACHTLGYPISANTTKEPSKPCIKEILASLGGQDPDDLANEYINGPDFLTAETERQGRLAKPPIRVVN